MANSWRFRRRTRLAPGLTLNIGKRGASSIRLGRRGLGVSANRRRGLLVTASLLGSGLSYVLKRSRELINGGPGGATVAVCKKPPYLANARPAAPHSSSFPHPFSARSARKREASKRNSISLAPLLNTAMGRSVVIRSPTSTGTSPVRPVKRRRTSTTSSR